MDGLIAYLICNKTLKFLNFDKENDYYKHNYLKVFSNKLKKFCSTGNKG